MQLVFDNFLGGRVFKFPVSDIDTFFDENYPLKLSNSGVTSFLKSLKIPASYFLKQPKETQLELLANQKLLGNFKGDILVYEKGGYFDFCCVGCEESLKTLLDRCPVNSSWTYISEDLSAGYIRYFFSDASIVDNDYNFGVFIDYPLLFAKPMIVNVGFYKINQESSDLNTELYLKDAKIKLKSDKLPETSHNIYFSDLLSASKSDNLHKYVDLLRNHNTDTETCINLLLSYEKDKMVSKGISSKVRKYIIKEELVLSNLEELS